MGIGRPISKKYKCGDVFASNKYGDFEVVEVDSATKIKVRFVLTGFVVFAQASHIKSGGVKDPTFPTMFGVGYFGVGRYSTVKNKRAYQTWKNMLARCYSEKYQLKNPTYKGCSVCPEWHDFQSFAAWYEGNYSQGFHLDKDIKIKGNKIYSPESCLFVSPSENTVEAHAGVFRFMSPCGEDIEVYNLSKFCRENNLTQGHMSSVHNGSGRKQHKGWSKSIK